MAQVLVRDLEPEVMERLKERAKRHGRSLEAELRCILREAGQTAAVTPDVARLQALFEGRTFTDSAELVREDRER